MKKLFYFFYPIFIVCFFCGCIIDSGTNDKKVTFQNENNYDGVFVIKFNPSKDFIKAKDSGKFNILPKSRFVQKENTENILDDVCKNYLKEKVFHDTSKINQFVYELNNNLLQDKSRNASDANIPVEKISEENYVLETEKDFYIIKEINTDNSVVSELKNAVLKAQNEFCNIWYIDNCDIVELKDEDFETLAQKFKIIYEAEIEILGTHKYATKSNEYFIEPCEKINIFVYDIAQDATVDQKSGVLGLFYSADCYKQNFLLEDTYSNETQCISVDSFYLKNYSDYAYSTLVHEFNHLLNFCQKTIIHGNVCDTWFTEMLAMISEDMFQTKLNIPDEYAPKNRLLEFGISYNYGFTDAWDRADVNTLIAYANTYAYGAYLVRNKGGFELLKELATSEFVNTEAIDKALLKFNVITEKIYDFESSAFYLSNVILSSISGYNEEAISLYKEIKYSKNNDLVFSKIDLPKTIHIGDVEYAFPFIYLNTTQLDLGGYGFSIHQIENYASIDFIVDKFSPIKVFPIGSYIYEK